jgi:hypothetical protein
MRPAQLALLFLLLPTASLYAQQPEPPRDEAALGLKCGSVPEALYAHLPTLERGQGLLVETVKPKSPAAELGLKQYDIVLAVGTTPVKSSSELHGKLSAVMAGESEVLQIVRGGKAFALTVASPSADNRYAPPKSLFKPGGPPAVSVDVKPLASGNLEVSLFYLSPANKMKRQVLQGSLPDIERQVWVLTEHGEMSENVHDLVSTALKRVRTKPPANSK